MKKKKVDPKVHELKFIDFLEKQISWNKQQPEPNKVEIEKLKYKLSKARLILKNL